jgi:prepilin-type processing-associated H-X9-DG protein/prepilin-type N-terminal cleavage/methylation domain-containing protein
MIARRRAFSILECLVVIALLGVLLGLLLSAIANVRAASASASCRDRLRQLSLANQSYHSDFQRFPPGTGKPDSADEPYPFMCWHVRLLPQLGQSSLWRDIQGAYAVDPDFRHNPPHKDKERPLQLFVCPSDPRTGGPSTKIKPINGFTSYLGVMGRDHNTLDGVLFLGSRISFSEITDGASQTLLIGERPPSADERLGWWYAGWGQHKDGSGDAVLGVRGFNQISHPNDRECPRGPYHFVWGLFEDQCDAYHFWSPHSGGAHFAFCDGSVRFLTYSADSVLPALATRAGGETVTMPD